MWISRYVTGNSFAADSPSMGEVRSAGPKVTVSASNDHRSVPTVAPFGIAYVPPVGSRSLVLPTDAETVCLGVIGQSDVRLLPGEVMLYSAGGASIVLKNDGRVLINGRTVE